MAKRSNIDKETLKEEYAIMVEQAHQDWIKRRDKDIQKDINKKLDKLKKLILALVFYYIDKYAGEDDKIKHDFVYDRADAKDIKRVQTKSLDLIAAKYGNKLHTPEAVKTIQASLIPSDINVGQLMQMELMLYVDESTLSILGSVQGWSDLLVTEEAERQEQLLEIKTPIMHLYDNLVYDEEIRKNQNNLKKYIATGLAGLLIQYNRKSKEDFNQELQDLMDKHISKDESFYLRRIVVSEAGKKQIQTQREFFFAKGFTHYLYITEVGACSVCEPLGGEIFPLEELAVGVNAPLMHPFCRCSIVGYIDMDELNDRYFSFYG